MHGAVHPRHRRLAHVAAGCLLLPDLRRAVNAGGAHFTRQSLLAHYFRAGVDQLRVFGEAEVVAGPAVGFARGVADDVLLERNEAGVARDFERTIHWRRQIKLQNAFYRLREDLWGFGVLGFWGVDTGRGP